jgi:hypothetical protein
MAFTAVTALVSGSAAVTAATVLAAVAEVGLALSVVGGITGNKTLSKIGGVMSLVGGVGGMLAGAAGGGASAASSLAETGADAATSAAWSTGADVGMDTMTNMGLDAAGSGGGGIINSAQSAAPDLASSLSGAPGNALEMAGAEAASGQMAVGADAAATSAAAPTANDVMTVGAPQTKTVSTPFDKGVSSPNAPEAASSFLGKFSAFADKNKTLFNSGLQLVGGAMKGATEQKNFATKADLEQQRINQTKFGNTTASFQPRKSGIIAGAQLN